MGAIKVWDGTAWQTAVGGGGATTYVGPNAPPGTPKSGDLWYDTDDVSQLVLPLSVVNGGTGATTAAAARTTLAMPGEELAYNQVTAQVNIASVAAASPTLVVEGTSRSYDGSPVLIEFYCGALQTPPAAGGLVVVNLWDGATDLGYFAISQTAAAAVTIAQVHAARRMTPTAGTHNYRIVAWTSGAGGAVAYAGAGGSANIWAPMFIRVTRA
jgi:hypothetical protein